MKNWLLLIVFITQQAVGSALFNQTNANFWLFEANGDISSYSYGNWLTEFNYTVYTLPPGSEDTVLINEIPASSTAMNSQLSPLSLQGLGDASPLATAGGEPLQVEPVAGVYNETIEVVMYVDASVIDTYGSVTLLWKVGEGAFSSNVLNAETESIEGYFENHFFLVKDGTHLVHVELLDNTNTEISVMNRSYSISTLNHPDGERRDTDLDGLPDLVEMAVGLNPLQDDWQTDSNGDGWADFDQWLRSANSNKNELPVDTDDDGWSDVDERWRGTCAADKVNNLITMDIDYPAPEQGTQSYRDTLLSFKEHPVVQRLYEVEYQVSASKQPALDTLIWNASARSYTLTGNTRFDSDSLLLDAQLAWAVVVDSDVEPVVDCDAGSVEDSLKQSTFTSRLAQDQIAEFRVAASLTQVMDVIADETVQLNPGTANEISTVRRWHYRTLLPSSADLTPARFIADDSWLTAEDWKQQYITFLGLNLVVDQTPALSLDQNLYVEALQLLLAYEIGLQGGTGLFSWDQMQLAHQDIMHQLQQNLSNRENGRNLWLVYEDLKNMLETGALTPTYNWLQTLQASSTIDVLDISQWLQQQALASGNADMEKLRYLGRFALFTDGLSRLQTEPGLEQTVDTNGYGIDTDGDSIDNRIEVDQPFVTATYPWASDTDEDGLYDGVDDCPVAEGSDCFQPALLQISTSAIISEPYPGQTQNLLISFQLDKAQDQDVSFSYVVTATGIDTATPDIDFTEMSDSLVIQAGQQVVSIAVPVLADSDFSEGSESFHVELSNVVNAVVPVSLSTVTISPALSLASNADLTALTISAGTLDQLFQISQLNYTASVNYTVTSTTLTATASDPAATLKLNGNPLDSGLPSDSIALSEGPNLIEIEVTAEDSSTQTYSITISRQNAASYAQQAYIKASNTGADDQFGKAIAISGDTLVVGAYQESGDVNSADGSYNDDALYAGAVYVFTRTSGVWTQQAYLKASNAQSGDEFGKFVALDGDTLAVGAPGEDGDLNSSVSAYNDLAVNAGAAYIFTRSSGIWTQQAYIKADTVQTEDMFGEHLALDGNTLAVGAVGEDDGGSSSGAVYVFTRSGSSWNQQARLKASNVQASDQFGRSLDIDGDTLAVGAIFEAGDATSIEGAYNENAPLAGAVYVFTRSVDVWTQQAYLKAENADLLDYFGESVALSGDTLAIGAYGEDGDVLSSQGSYNNSAPGSGAVYVFTRTSGLWTQQAYIKAPNAEAGDQFGQNVNLELDSLAVAATLEDGDTTSSVGSYNNNALSAGAVYYFARSGSNWNLLSYIKASNAEANDRFGTSLGLSGDTLVSGAYGEDSAATGINGDQFGTGATDSGAAYVFQ